MAKTKEKEKEKRRQEESKQPCEFECYYCYFCDIYGLCIIPSVEKPCPFYALRNDL